ncbi:C39 family peptidase [Enterococcus sp. 669A]|uniref:C39 family peptidase n=1 Tax=Candidatus Enterococcus moelleringii TaxID=2815325 RepID=A0ABS3LFN1_9ENTE|nr:C39 family peptidase [Enterococcus sp. 669A]MBO1308425.1 C39 family peptidase [Enterococcus sp. 669A]
MKRKKSVLPILLGSILIIASACIFALRALSERSPTVSPAFADDANRHLSERGQDMTLMLQTDPQWAATPYGSGSDYNDIATNGCAITSLAMVLSYYQKRVVLPTEILDWSQDRYYVSGQGTAWSIFPDFAATYQLSYEDLGLDAGRIQERLQQNQPVVLSVNPGEFTGVGHIMVIKKDIASDQIVVYDPNDTPEKHHYQNTYSLDYILSQSANAWAFAPL